MYRDALRERTGADLLVNQEGKRHLVDLLAPHRPALADPRAAASAPAFTTTRALVKVQDGCDFFCSYCIVPYARGRSTSLPLGDIVDNVRRLTAHGYREVVLTGANLGCYQDQAHGLPELVEALQALPDLWRIRISSIEISTSETVVLEAMAGSDKLCRFLHLPVQSGDDDVLRRMRRRYDTAALRRLVASAVDRLPTLGLGADIIVGFPGESEAAFANTRRLIEDLPFSNLHVFPYSPRPGTPAADMPDQVPVPIRKTRAAELIALGRRKREAFAASFVGQSVEVLVERTDADGRHRGWTSEYVEVRFHDADAGVNDLVRLTPTSTDGTMLLA